MDKPTYDDVNLILKLYDLRREPRLREARRWFIAAFKAKTLQELNALCPPGSEENASYRQMTTHCEMVASFLTLGVLNPELYYSERSRAAGRVGADAGRAAGNSRRQQESARIQEPGDRREGLHRLVAGAGARGVRGVQQAGSRLTPKEFDRRAQYFRPAFVARVTSAARRRAMRPGVAIFPRALISVLRGRRFR